MLKGSVAERSSEVRQLLIFALVAACACVAHADDPLVVRRGAFQDRVLLTGTLEATRGVRLTPPRTNSWQIQIRWIEEDGVTVSAGDKLVELDNAEFATDLEQTRLAAQKAEKELQRQRAQAEAQSAELAFAVSQRRVELEKAQLEADVPKELLPLREYQEKQLARERARTALEKAEQELATQRRTSAQEVAVQEIALEKTPLRHPHCGKGHLGARSFREP